MADWLASTLTMSFADMIFVSTTPSKCLEIIAFQMIQLFVEYLIEIANNQNSPPGKIFVRDERILNISKFPNGKTQYPTVTFSFESIRIVGFYSFSDI